MTRKPLGRGLGALLSADKGIDATDSTEIDPSLIEPCSVQPRIRFDDASLSELADSIRANGVVQPLLVRRKAVALNSLQVSEDCGLRGSPVWKRCQW